MAGRVPETAISYAEMNAAGDAAGDAAGRVRRPRPPAGRLCLPAGRVCRLVASAGSAGHGSQLAVSVGRWPSVSAIWPRQPDCA